MGKFHKRIARKSESFTDIRIDRETLDLIAKRQGCHAGNLDWWEIAQDVKDTYLFLTSEQNKADESDYWDLSVLNSHQMWLRLSSMGLSFKIVDGNTVNENKIISVARSLGYLHFTDENNQSMFQRTGTEE